MPKLRLPWLAALVCGQLQVHQELSLVLLEERCGQAFLKIESVELLRRTFPD